VTRGALSTFVVIALVAGCDCGDRVPPTRSRIERPETEVEEEVPPTVAVGRWTPLAEEGAPVGRDGFAAGAFGRRVFVWGGHTVDGQFQTYLNGGAILDVAEGQWRDLGTEGAPTARVRHVAVFADVLLFIWGGRDGMNPLGDGGIYDPDTRAWLATSAANAPPPTSDGSAVFTGEEIILFGGVGAANSYHGGGAVYDPRANTFRPMTSIGAPSPRAGHSATWTGEEMIIWGGVGPAGALGDGARYDPRADAWRPLSADGAPSPRLRHAAVWTGDQMVVWGGDRRGTELLGDGAIYLPAEDAWRGLPSGGAPSARTGFSGTWIDGRVVVWGGETAEGLVADGGAFDPVTDAWAPLTLEGAPSPRRDHRARATDAGMVVWGGLSGGDEYPISGSVFTL